MPNSKLKYKDNEIEEAKEYSENVVECSWEEFRSTGLLWWINMILHTFGWAIVVNRDIETKKIIDVWPARVKFRGFDEKDNTEGYMKVSKYLTENADELLKESQE